MSAHASAVDLSLLIDRQLPQERADWLEQHIEDCEECRERYLSTRRLVDGMQSLERVAPPSTLGMVVQQHRLEVGNSRLRKRLERPWKRWPDPVILGYLGVVVALGFMAVGLSRIAERREATSTVIFAPTQVADESAALPADGTTWIEPGISADEVEVARPASVVQIRAALERLGESIPEDTSWVVARVENEVIRFSPPALAATDQADSVGGE